MKNTLTNREMTIRAIILVALILILLVVANITNDVGYINKSSTPIKDKDTVRENVVKDKIDTNEDTVVEELQFNKLDLPIFDCTTDKQTGNTSVFISNNLVDVEQELSYVFATTNTDAYIYIDNYDYSGSIKDQNEFIDNIHSQNKEIAISNGMTLKVVDETEELKFYSLISEEEHYYLIYQFKDNLVVTYSINFFSNNEENTELVYNLYNELNKAETV